MFYSACSTCSRNTIQGIQRWTTRASGIEHSESSSNCSFFSVRPLRSFSPFLSLWPVFSPFLPIRLLTALSPQPATAFTVAFTAGDLHLRPFKSKVFNVDLCHCDHQQVSVVRLPSRTSFGTSKGLKDLQISAIHFYAFKSSDLPNSLTLNLFSFEFVSLAVNHSNRLNHFDSAVEFRRSKIVAHRFAAVIWPFQFERLSKSSICKLTD